MDNTWTLFLDRDGVINKNIDGGYVLDWSQFEFLEGVLETFPKLADRFSRIIVVTNQQCIAKGLLSVSQLDDIHNNMINTIQANQGKIDAVYYAPDMASPTNKLRKPEIGMALVAKNDFPEINFQKSIMVGDKITDMTFGKSAGMITVYLSNASNTPDNADYHIGTFADLLEVIALAKAQRHKAT